jgi:hypothetical protein
LKNSAKAVLDDEAPRQQYCEAVGGAFVECCSSVTKREIFDGKLQNKNRTPETENLWRIARYEDCGIAEIFTVQRVVN